MEKTEVRWVLAFDASCAKCRQLSARMASSCDGKLEVLPLAHQEVVRWREEAFGSQAVWEPALFSVDGEKVRGWTGRAMGVPLVRRLGLGSTLSVLRALGQLREVTGSPTDELASTPPGAVNRKRFLQLGAGALVAGGLMVTGKLPAYASADKAGAWVAANASNLPSTYDAITAHTMEYRKAIYQTLTPSAKSKLWIEQLARFRSAHGQLTAAQLKVLDSAAATVANPATFAAVATTSTLSRSDQELRTASEKAFGRTQTRQLMAVLGPENATPAGVAQPADQRSCTCSNEDDWCDNSTHCFSTNCQNHVDCGSWWNYNCNGLCRN